MIRERKLRVDFRNLHRESRESKRVIIRFKICIKRVIGSSIHVSLAQLFIRIPNNNRSELFSRINSCYLVRSLGKQSISKEFTVYNFDINFE